MVESALTQKAITNFFNDIVAFYLIKVHGNFITKRWLQNPVANSNAWLTTFYLVSARSLPQDQMKHFRVVHRRCPASGHRRPRQGGRALRYIL